MHPATSDNTSEYEPDAEYVPLEQPTQTVDGSLSWSSSPAGQVVHSEAPAAEYCPDPHASHCNALPTLL